MSFFIYKAQGEPDLLFYGSYDIIVDLFLTRLSSLLLVAATLATNIILYIQTMDPPASLYIACKRFLTLMIWAPTVREIDGFQEIQCVIIGDATRFEEPLGQQSQVWGAESILIYLWIKPRLQDIAIAIKPPKTAPLIKQALLGYRHYVLDCVLGKLRMHVGNQMVHVRLVPIDMVSFKKRAFCSQSSLG